MNQKEYADYLHDAETAFLALVKRAETLRENSPYRFYQTDSQSISAWLDKYYIPIESGWKQHDILRLEELLGQKVPDDYKLFLKYLGNLGEQMFGYDDDLRTPADYLENRDHYLNFGEQWGEASTDPSFNDMMEDGIFLSGLGGFAVWYLAPQKSERSIVKFWDEGDGNSVMASIKIEGFLVESMEDRMTRFEWRTEQNCNLGGTLVYGRGSQVTPQDALDSPVLQMPHTEYSVDLSERQKQQLNDHRLKPEGLKAQGSGLKVRQQTPYAPKDSCQLYVLFQFKDQPQDRAES